MPGYDLLYLELPYLILAYRNSLSLGRLMSNSMNIPAYIISNKDTCTNICRFFKLNVS